MAGTVPDLASPPRKALGSQRSGSKIFRLGVAKTTGPRTSVLGGLGSAF